LKRPLLLLISLALSFCANATLTESHGYAQFGTLKYPAKFTHFDWVNPDAPKGGTLRVMAFGTFDTLNPYTFKGTSPVSTANFLQYGVNELNETLMVGTGQYAPSGDEPTSSYGLIAQSVEYNEDRSWVVFNLRPKRVFMTASPLPPTTWRFPTTLLLKEGHPQYRTNLQEVAAGGCTQPQAHPLRVQRAGQPVVDPAPG
jgi:microcin C transport system substrate-binding protein